MLCSVDLGRPAGVLAQQTETHAAPPAVEAGQKPTGLAEEPHHEETTHAETGEGEHEEGLFPTVARLINAGTLFGSLFYLLRKPIARYLSGRQTQVRQDLLTAMELRKAAAEQLEELDRRMRALPGEIDALKAQGAEEIAQEEARIAQTAEMERQRLVEQAHREIDLQLRIAQRELVEHAADLAIGVATERIKKGISDEDQARLVDRYVEQLKK